MSENLPPPPPPPDSVPPAPPAFLPPRPKPGPGLLACIFIGMGLFLGSGGLAFLFPPLAFVGFAAAIASLFFDGYRGICLGYFLTCGVVLLGAIIFCFATFSGADLK